MSIVVVGDTSLIAQALRQGGQTAGWRFIGHREALAGSAWLDGVSQVLNLAYNPALRNGYEHALDFELALARRIEPLAQVRYIMASSRLVYGPALNDQALHESQEPQPVATYGIGKLITERAMTQMLGERLTIVRMSNIFGYELEQTRRNFFAIALRSLLGEQRIVLDMSPFVERDFLPVEILANWLARIAENPQPGIFNLGSGIGTPTGRIAQWLLEGFGRGELLVTNLREFDAFRLDMGAARSAYGIPGLTSNALRQHCLALGARLHEESRLLQGYA
ncbi:sugar nucleotide-binding protein [Pseudomonas kielensis]|uniref:NAD-dependent epimerase/dehydratase family protein n=1 Tax=Pseudomonas kielensis TaxID=2762577 RepID=UPI00223F409D|nr:NAD-dependent epimerase/dehydratase family protein [Pseudomonas kielensis]UZM13542.1 sugar nucleotide-binding protein [Pseudomonas kielensis]